MPSTTKRTSAVLRSQQRSVPSTSKHTPTGECPRPPSSAQQSCGPKKGCQGGGASGAFSAINKCGLHVRTVENDAHFKTSNFKSFVSLLKRRR
ncbi:hypothetical protein TSMEX_008294 [Taenia solium]